MTELNYNHLRYFRAVARDGTLTGAARRLNLAPSALSVQLRALEDRLGHRLFDRVGRGLRLTEAGRIALDHAEAIFAAGEELVATLRQTGQARRALRVGALATLSRNFLLAFLRPVLGRADVEVVLRSGGWGELMRGLEAHGLDVVLANRPAPRDGPLPLLSRRIAEEPVALVGRPGREGDLRALLAEGPLVLPTPETALREGLDALLARWGIRPAVAAEVDDVAMIRLLAREGAGLAPLPPIAAADELDAGVLRDYGALPGLVEAFWALTAERRFPNPLLAEVLAAAAPGEER